MSEQDSFIDEVTDEVRRDKLYAAVRRYGWIGISAVVLIVGGAAYNEYRNAQATAAAQARGDAILAAMENQDLVERANGIEAAGDGGEFSAVAGLLSAGQATLEEGRPEAIARLEALAGDTSLPPLYRDLAVLKSTLLNEANIAPQDRIERLSPLTAPGAPYRVLALELTALAHASDGNTDEALSIYTSLVEDAEATEGLRQRATQMIVALGGSVDAL